MWRLFQKWGKVWEVFIPQRRNRLGKRFGFVKFLDVGDLLKLARDLDQIFIGETKLFVNIPMFDREQRTVGGQNQISSERRGYKGQYHQHGRSYAEAATKGQRYMPKQTRNKEDRNRNPKLWKVESITVVEEIDEWLLRSKVGRLREPEAIASIQEAFYTEGFKTVTVRYMGDKLMLLTGEEGTDLSVTLRGWEEWLGDIFESILLWDPTISPGHRFAWVRCEGLPPPPLEDVRDAAHTLPTGTRHVTCCEGDGVSGLEVNFGLGNTKGGKGG